MPKFKKNSKLTLSSWIAAGIVATILGTTVNTSEAKTAWEVTSCKLARDSNRNARNWSVMPRPSNEKQYQAWVDKSPWCSWGDGNAANHKLILHHSSNGATQSILIHKVGAAEWVKANIGYLSKECAVPRGWTKRKLKYLNGKQCYVEVRQGPWAPYLHQWGVSNKKGKGKHTKSLPPIKFMNKRRR